MAKSIASLKSSYSVNDVGSLRMVPQVFALGKRSSVNSTVGYESKPSGGGSAAPVINIMTSVNEAFESPPERGKQSKNKNIWAHN